MFFKKIKRNTFSLDGPSAIVLQIKYRVGLFNNFKDECIIIDRQNCLFHGSSIKKLGLYVTYILFDGHFTNL